MSYFLLLDLHQFRELSFIQFVFRILSFGFLRPSIAGKAHDTHSLSQIHVVSATTFGDFAQRAFLDFFGSFIGGKYRSQIITFWPFILRKKEKSLNSY